MKALLEKIEKSQADLAKYCGISRASICLIFKDQWPKRHPERTREKIHEFFVLNGCSERAIAKAMTTKPAEVKAAPKAPARKRKPQPKATPQPAARKTHTNSKTSEDTMLLQKVSLTPAARRHFSLARNPFAEDLRSADDVFMSPDIRYVRESMWDVAKNGGFLAVVGESGSGKSTLREEMGARIVRENAHIIVCEPYVLAMEVNDEKGKTLKSTQIAEALIAAIDPTVKPRNTPQGRFDQLHKLLKASHQGGMSHVLLIEEAHCLPTATLKHLKRFREMKDGFEFLLGILLIGQPELKAKLSTHNPEVREVAQRCEMVELLPLDRHIEEYVAHKLKRVGLNVTDIFNEDAFDAIRARLIRNPRGNKTEVQSLCYPLVVNNLICSAMNTAAAISAAKVCAEVIREVA